MRRKYGNKPTVVDDIRFASMKEAKRYGDLKILKQLGEITSLELQPRYAIVLNGHTVTMYVGDFRYCERQKDDSLKLVVEDVKGMKTPVFKLKWKMVQALYPEIEWRLS